MKIFNSFTQKLDPIDLKSPIGLYVCGVTPYDTTHLGHAFTYITYDVLIRYLRYLGSSLIYVQNVTDIDDDILRKSKSLHVNWQQLAKSESEKHLQNMDNLNALRPDYFPFATDHIDQMIKIIKVLISKKLGYAKNGSVYFEVGKDKNFGKLSNMNYSVMLEIANQRGNNPLDPNKIDPLDFVLWQAQKPGEPAWDSPWGKGRPGWHIECSAMSMKYLGETVTIHGGGEDLIFPHHEAEIAQSENFTGKKFVKVWMHVAMVYCDGQKMSKSLGNMIFISDLLKKYNSNAIRIYLLSHHYLTSWEHSEIELKRARQKAKNLEKFLGSPETIEAWQAIRKFPEFFQALENDLNTPKTIDLLIRYANSKNPDKKLITTCAQILGLRT